MSARAVGWEKGLSLALLLIVPSAASWANDPPVARTDMILYVVINTPTVGELEAEDGDGTIVAWEILTPPLRGMVVPGGDTPGGHQTDYPTFTYTPAAGYFGGDWFEFRARDNEGAWSNTGAVYIWISSNHPPTATAQSLLVPSGAAAEIVLSGTDIDGSIVAYRIESGPAQGGLTGTAPHVSYTSNPGFAGEDAFTFGVQDDDGVWSGSPATVLLEVVPRAAGEWRLMNAGGAVDAQEAAPPLDENNGQVMSATDGQGNLVYLFPSAAFGLCMGRLNAVGKAWEAFTMAGGWSSAANMNLILQPALRDLGLVQSGQMRSAADGSLLAVMNCKPRLSGLPVDVEGAAIGLQWDGSTWQFYGSGGFGKTLARPLASGERGAGTPSFAWDGLNWGVAVCEFGEQFEGSQIGAARFVLDDGSGTPKWQHLDEATGNWGSPLDDENHRGLPWNDAPVADPGGGTAYAAFDAPVVAYAGGGEFVGVCHMRDQRTTPNRQRVFGLHYNNNSQTWSWWDGTGGWGTLDAFASAEPMFPWASLASDEGFFYPRAVAAGSSVSFLYRDAVDGVGEISELVYTRTGPDAGTWGAGTEIVASAHGGWSYQAAAAPGGEIWLVYADADRQALLRRIKSGGVWGGAEMLFCAAQPGEPVEAVGLDFGQGGTPVVFVKKTTNGGASNVFALSDASLGFWAGEQTVARGVMPAPSVALDPERLAWQQEFANYAENASPLKQPIGGAGFSSHMDIDDSGYFYSPHMESCTLCIFPPAHDGTIHGGRFWGEDWQDVFFPTGVAVDDARRRVYVANQRDLGGSGCRPSGEILMYSLGDRTVNYWNANKKNPPRIEGDFRYLSDVAVDESRARLYAVDSMNNRIQVFDLSPTATSDTAVPAFVRSFGSTGAGPGQFDFPQGIAIDGAGDLYVADSRNHRVQKLSPDGGFLMNIGGLGREPGKFLYPYSVDVDTVRWAVYVTDPMNDMIHVFRTSGELVYAWSHWTQGSGACKDLTAMGGLAVRGDWIYVGTGEAIQKFRGVNPLGKSAARDWPAYR